MIWPFGKGSSTEARRQLGDGSCCDLDAHETMVIQAEDGPGPITSGSVPPAMERIFGAAAT
jgi:hypothetical protein